MPQAGVGYLSTGTSPSKLDFVLIGESPSACRGAQQPIVLWLGGGGGGEGGPSETSLNKVSQHYQFTEQQRESLSRALGQLLKDLLGTEAQY